jgi:hypothetical protein
MRRTMLSTTFAAIVVTTLMHCAGQTTIYVNTTAQGVTSGQCSLQEAIYSAEFGKNIAIDQTDPDDTYTTGCVSGTGSGDTIVLPGGTLEFDHFWDGDAHNPFGPTATPIIFTKIVIQGNGTTLQWTGSGYSRMFAVGQASITPTAGVLTGITYSGTGDLTIQDVWIRGFQVKGGDGGPCKSEACLALTDGVPYGDGGGGGLGAGGAIYLGKVSSGVPSLTVQNSTFDSNTATGGNGTGFALDTCGGGGGGLSGNEGFASGGDGGGGGGGARGDGGDGFGQNEHDGGGGGGGTVFTGGIATIDSAGDTIGGASGYLCGGNGGDAGNDGHSASCPGGGGGGGGDISSHDSHGDAGDGQYGGGGGGGGGDGGHGGFGGGGGSGCRANFSLSGGDGGFGGGGGGASGILELSSSPGSGGAFGGDGSNSDGGGGGGLGGAIFNDSGNVTIQNSTFYNNSVKGGKCFGGPCAGSDAGGAIFSRNGTLLVQNATISGNHATYSGGGIEVYKDGSTTTFLLDNTIVSGNGSQECIVHGSVVTTYSGAASAANLITSNDSCPSATPDDPQLGGLQVNPPGDTPTMAIVYGVSPAVDVADDNTALATDQRGVTRPQGSHADIGAFEAIVQYPLTLQVSPASGGSTSPSGTVLEVPDAVIDVSATAASGYYFLNWTGNVASTTSASTTVTMPSQADTITANFQQHDFSISSSPNPVSLKLGGSASATVTVTSLGNFADKVSLTATGTGIPAGVSVSFNPTSLTPSSGGSATSTLGFVAGPSVTPQSFSETLTGSSTGIAGTLSHQAVETVTMTVTAADLINVVNENQVLGCINNSGLAQSLNAKLNAFQLLSTKGQNVATVNTMAAFRYEVQAQSGVHIATTCTDNGTQFSPPQTLLTDAQYLLTSMGALPPADPIMGSVVNSSGVGISGATVSLLSSSKTVLATSMTDALGFYYFAGTNVLNQGSSYTVKVSPPTGYKSATPATQSFTWSTSAVQLNRVVLN